ncbi:MAG: RNA polymerase sigma factor [Cellvibrionaceae bacterium]
MNTDQKDERGRALLSAIGGGDDAALTEFYGLFNSTVYRYASSKLNDTHSASDILADVMVEVWKSAHRYAGKSKVTTWLIGIAHHKVVDMYRKKGRANLTELDDSIEDESPISDLEGLISQLSDSRVLHKALANLPELHREILHLVFFEDMNYAEISEILNIPEGTIKSRVFNAKNKLKDVLIAIS